MITLSRPEVLNAINVSLLEHLIAALRASADAGAVVLQAEGRAFCVGEDLKETLAPTTGTNAELRRALEQLQEVTRLVTALPCPVIAAVQGHAIGGGAELALVADIVMAGPAASFRFPEVPLGHAPTGGITARLTALCGLLRAKDLLLTGRTIAVDEALQIGLVTRVVADPGESALALASELALSPVRSMAATKRAVELAAFSNQELILQLETDAASYCFAAPEATQSITAFQARRGGL